MTTTTLTTGDLALSLAELLHLDIGLIWHCRTCPMQSYRVHNTVLGGRHDALGHVLRVHLGDIRSADVTLQLVPTAAIDLRHNFRQHAANAKADPPLEYSAAGGTTPLSPAEQDLVCNLIGCAPDAEHRTCW